MTKSLKIMFMQLLVCSLRLCHAVSIYAHDLRRYFQDDKFWAHILPLVKKENCQVGYGKIIFPTLSVRTNRSLAVMQILIGALDLKSEHFAKEVGADILKDSKSDWTPDKYGHRTLNWIENGFRFSTAVYPILKNEQLKKWAVGAWCVVEKGSDIYSAHDNLIETKKLANIIVDIDSLLQIPLLT